MEDPYRFAHHASSRPDFDAHVVRLGGLYFCRGCLLTSAGMLASPVFALVWLSGRLDEIGAGLCFYGVVGLQVANRFVRFRAGSAFARAGLGFVIGSAAQLFFLTEHTWVRLAILGHYAVFRLTFPDWLRRHE